MCCLFLKDILQSSHFISNKSSSLLILKRINFSLIIFNLLINIFKLFFKYICSWLFINKFVLFFSRSCFLFLLLNHLIYFNNLIFKFSVTLLQLLNVFRYKLLKKYLISYESFSFYRILCLLEWGVSRKSTLYLCIRLLFIYNNYIHKS